MPPKKQKAAAGAKGPKLTQEQEAIQMANAVDDNYDAEYKKALKWECRELEKQIKKEEELGGLYNDERLRINYFWIVGKKELEDKQAELRNKNRELQDLQEKNDITIKIFKQRLKHLMFQNLDQQTMVKKQAQISLKNSEDEHRITERELKQDLRSLKVSKKEQEVRQTEYLNSLQRAYMAKATSIRKEFERISNEIQTKYKNKMTLLRTDMEKKRKAEIQKIESKKNQAIEDLKAKHEEKYQAIKEFYNEITMTNTDLIKTLKGDLKLERIKENHANKQETYHQAQNDMIVKPLEAIKKEIKELELLREKYLKIKALLQETQEGIVLTDKQVKEIEWEYEVKLQQYNYLESEKSQLFDEFHRLVYEVHQKTGLRNLILEKKLETIQESMETKDAQINQILATARIDPQALGMIRSTLEEVEQMKNEAIREIQTELKKIREAHSNMVKTYEGKLTEFGIPVEELGFDPLVPANI